MGDPHRVRLGLEQLFGAAVEVTYVRLRLEDLLAVHLQHEAQDAVRRGVLRPEIQLHFLHVEERGNLGVLQRPPRERLGLLPLLERQHFLVGHLSKSKITRPPCGWDRSGPGPPPPATPRDRPPRPCRCLRRGSPCGGGVRGIPPRSGCAAGPGGRRSGSRTCPRSPAPASRRPDTPKRSRAPLPRRPRRT